MQAYAKPQGKRTGKDTVQKKDGRNDQAPNLTGIPDKMKSSYEQLSGLSFNDVRVHYNSDKPAQMQAYAYTQGEQVHIAPGQEKHLGHELGHVVQQKQGRVAPTVQLQGVSVNDDEDLELEADEMDEEVRKALYDGVELSESEPLQLRAGGGTVQMSKWQWNARTKRWSCITNDAIKPRPRRDGKYDGEIVDDTPLMAVVGEKEKPLYIVSRILADASDIPVPSIVQNTIDEIKKSGGSHNPFPRIMLLKIWKVIGSSADMAELFSQKKLEQIETIMLELGTKYGQLLQNVGAYEFTVKFASGSWDLFLENVSSTGTDAARRMKYVEKCLFHDKGFAQTSAAVQAFAKTPIESIDNTLGTLTNTTLGGMPLKGEAVTIESEIGEAESQEELREACGRLLMAIVNDWGKEKLRDDLAIRTVLTHIKSKFPLITDEIFGSVVDGYRELI